ncbi:MAG: phosphotransferase family protein [Janthinobacterium lividum]
MSDDPPLRSGWQRAAPELTPTLAEVAALLAPALPRARVVAATSLSGGLSNTNLCVTLDRPPHRVLLRLAQYAAPSAAREAAFPALLRPRGVPIPRVLHATPENPITGGPATVCEWIDADRLDLLAAARHDASALYAIATAVGTALATVHAIYLPHLGFLGDGLDVAHAIDLDAPALLAFLDERLLHGEGLHRLGSDLAAATLAWARRHAARLGDWPSPPCLAHGDCNPSNILLRRHGPGWAVAALLDWEFALSGLPALDFATLLRPGLADRPGFTDGLAQGYRDAGGTLPDNWKTIARIADLFAWGDMLSRPGRDPAVTRDATRVIRRLLEEEGRALPEPAKGPRPFDPLT